MRFIKYLILALAIFASSAPIGATAFARNGADDAAGHNQGDDFGNDGAGHR